MIRKILSFKPLLLLFCILTADESSAKVIDWTSSNIQLLYGNDFEFGDDERTTVTVEHAHGWQYGTNFFFVDLLDRNDIGFEVYAEVYSYLSLNKLGGHSLALGPVKDVSLMVGLNISNKPENDSFKAYLFGLSFDFSNPLTDYLQLDIAAYKADDISGKYGLQFTPVWSIPFDVASLRFKFRGFTDFRTGNTNASGHFHILAQPQLLLDMGNLVGWKNDKVYIGTEYSLWYNKFGVKGAHESVVQAMIIAFF
ncbi:MAG: DUF5020 family protein [Methylosarcina sp.]